jgi:hypothetical protein
MVTVMWENGFQKHRRSEDRNWALGDKTVLGYLLHISQFAV